MRIKKEKSIMFLTFLCLLVIPITTTNAMKTGESYALILGISDYKAISDLRFCDDDANDWFNYITTLGYDNIVVLGDHSSSFLQFDGLATEYNVKAAISEMVSKAGPKDRISIFSSGHGAGDHKGTSLLCMWDYAAGENGEDGRLYDFELADLLSPALAGDIFVFLDHCFAGGFGDDLMNLDNSKQIYLAAACTEKGMGWDAGLYSNGLWTYFFLEHTLINHFESNPKTKMEDAFASALIDFPYHTGTMVPQEFDGDLSSFFWLI